MVIGLVTIRFSIPESRSLKDKRSVIRSMKDRAVGKMNVSVGEVGEQDVWQFSEMAFVTVAATHEVVQKRISDISSFVRSNPRIVVMDLSTQFI